MRTIIIFFLTSIFFLSYAQTVYEVTPGTKGNKLILSLYNISEITNAEDVQMILLKESQNLSFNKEELIVENINAKEEKEAAFSFDIKREAPVGVTDTIEFIITDNKTIFTTKQFIFSYTPPKDYKLEQNFPNPFNPATTIQYQLPADSKVTLKVYDILGGEVAVLIKAEQDAGFKEVKFDASSLSSGIYIYSLTAENPSGGSSYISNKKMILLR